MSAIELKSKLIDKINALEDISILKEVTRLLDINLNGKEEMFNLTDEMNEAIDEAQLQIKNGDFLNHKEANQEIKEWLDK